MKKSRIVSVFTLLLLSLFLLVPSTAFAKTRYLRDEPFHYINMAKGTSKKWYPNRCDDKSTKLTYKSSNKKVAVVSKSGKIKALKPGYTVITATHKDKSIAYGIVVNVAKNKNMLKLVDRAEYIYDNWEYDQSRRTKKGYYDCSSLVWQVYNEYQKINFGTTWMGTTATESKWCEKHVKQISQKGKKYQLGDISFMTETKKGKIYHVMTFGGYSLSRFKGNGKPVVTENWIFDADGYIKSVYRPTAKK